jgi:hypothetical protein
VEDAFFLCFKLIANRFLCDFQWEHGKEEEEALASTRTNDHGETGNIWAIRDRPPLNTVFGWKETR